MSGAGRSVWRAEGAGPPSHVVLAGRFEESAEQYRAGLKRDPGKTPNQNARLAWALLAEPVDAAIDTARRGYRKRLIAELQARIVTEQRRNVLLVPQAAVLTDPDTGKKNVVVVGADSVAHVVPVMAGLSADGRVEIQSGLTEGQKVVTSGLGMPDWVVLG